MRGDLQHQRTSAESRSIQRECKYILREVTMPCCRLERHWQSVCRCRGWGIPPAAVAGDVSLRLVRQFEVSEDCAYVRVNTGWILKHFRVVDRHKRVRYRG